MTNLTATHTLSTNTAYIQNLNLRVDVVHMCAMMLCALASLTWSLLHFLPYGLGSLANLQLNSYVQFIDPPILMTILRSSTI